MVEVKEMGYRIAIADNKLAINKVNFTKALDALKSLFTSENFTCTDYGKDCQHFSWINTKTVLESKTLGEAMEGIRFSPLYDPDGNITGVDFTGENDGDESIFLNALAPYVVSDSHISFVGEDGNMWKWIFRNGKVSRH